MATKTSQALSSRAIIGMIYAAIEGLGASAWPFKVAYTNFGTIQNSEEYAVLATAPAMRKWIGGRNAKRLLAQTLTLINDKFEASIVDFKDNFRYDNTGQLNAKINDLASRTVTHWGKLFSEALELGTSTLTFDGQNFYSASHVFGNSGTQSNLLTASDITDLNVTTATAPTPYEMMKAIDGVIAHFFSYTDDSGEPINEDATNFLVQVPVNLGRSARAAVTRSILDTGSGSADNVLVNSGYTIEVVVNPRLTSTTAFHTMRTDGLVKPLIAQQRGGVETSSKAEGSDFEHDTDQWEFGVKAERAAGLFGWTSAIRATLS